MKEYIKLFYDLESADGYIIADIPFTSTVSSTEQNVRCNVGNKKLVVSGETVEVVENVKPIPLNTILHLNNAPDVELTATTITSSMTSSYKSALIGLEIGRSVTNIGSSAFSGCRSLTSVTISNSVTSIGSQAFSNCSGLTKVNITDIAAWCNIAFSGNGCNPLFYAGHLYLNDIEVTDLVIPNSVTSIGHDVFSGCTSLTSVTIPNSVTSIGDRAFTGCTSLTSVAIPNSVTSIGIAAFSDCTSLTSVTIPYGVTSIGIVTFTNCSSLTSVTIPDSVTSIGSHAFKGCSNLTGITIPSSVTSIGEYVFTGCTRLSSITIPDSVTTIGQRIFDSCTSLSSVTIGSGVTNISKYFLFINCPSLVSITVDSNNTNYDSRNNCNAIIETSSNTLFLGCKNTDIPDNITSIGEYAFYSCAGLTSVTIPDSVTKINKYAFYSCKDLTSIVIGSGVTSIATGYNSTDDAAFSGCHALTSVTVDSNNTIYDSRDNCNAIIHTQTNSMQLGCQTTVIPNSVTRISNGAFAFRKAPSALTIPSNIQYIDANAFYVCIGLTSLVIPNTVAVGEASFKYCHTLTSANINSGTIAKQAFYGCTALTATLGSGVTSIGQYAFTNVPIVIYPGSATGSPWGAKLVCGAYEDDIAYSDAAKTRLKKCMDTTLTAVTIPSSVTTIEYGAFSGCTGLTSITIPDSVTSIGINAFRGCTSLSSVTIPSGVTSLGDGAFSGCTSLPILVDIRYTNTEYTCLVGTVNKNQSSYTIPSTVKWICSSAFQGCTGLTNIDIPSSVTSIGGYAFSSCSGITSVVIPSSVTFIDSNAFYYGYGTDYSYESPCPITAFTCNNVTYPVDGAENISITLANGTSVELHLWTYYCFLAGTQITLADGTTKAIENIEYTDELKVWNFDEGKYDTAYPMWISKPGTMERYFIITLDDGTVLKVSGANSGHKIYNVDENKFEGCVSIEVGTHVYTENGIKEIVSKETINEPITYYNLMTDRHINCFAEGILTSMRYNSIYPFSEDMKFIKDGRELRPYSEFEVVGISRYWYDGLRLAEQTDSLERINAYVKRLEKKMLPKE